MVRLVYWAVTVLVAAALALFVVANRQGVQLALTPFTEPLWLPLWTVVLAALAVAFLVGNLAGWLGARRWRRETRFLRRRLASLERDLATKEGQLRAAAPPVSSASLVPTTASPPGALATARAQR
jgi:uncharacterized integral membrane protein